MKLRMCDAASKMDLLRQEALFGKLPMGYLEWEENLHIAFQADIFAFAWNSPVSMKYDSHSLMTFGLGISGTMLHFNGFMSVLCSFLVSWTHIFVYNTVWKMISSSEKLSMRHWSCWQFVLCVLQLTDINIDGS